MQTYEITTRTGIVKGAGTDSNIYIQLIDCDGKKSAKHELDTRGNNFEKGMLETFIVNEISELNRIEWVEISKDTKGKYEAWYLEYVEVKKKDDSRPKRFIYERWFSEKDGLSAKVKALASGEHEYAVLIKTGNERYAGTNGTISVVLEGDKGRSGRYILDNHNNNFERGMYERFIVPTIEDLGNLRKIYIRTESFGDNSGWFVSFVEVIKNDDLNLHYHCICNYWSGEEEDTSEERWFDLQPGGIRPQGSYIKNAFFSEHNRKVYFFTDNEYIRYNYNNDKSDSYYPRSISNNWNGIWEDGADAVIARPGNKAHQVYFFKGKEYMRYDMNRGKVDSGYPRLIKDNWKGLWDRDIDCAVSHPSKPYKIYFFKGNEYIRYDFSNNKADSGYPKSVSGNWDGVWNDGIDAAVPGTGKRDNKIYFFKGNEYKRYDMNKKKVDEGYPRLISLNWPGVWFDNSKKAEVTKVMIELESVKCYDTEDWTGDDELYIAGAVQLDNNRSPYVTSLVYINDGETKIFQGDEKLVYYNEKTDNGKISMGLVAYDRDISASWKKSELRETLDGISSTVSFTKTALNLFEITFFDFTAKIITGTIKVLNSICDSDEDDKLGKVKLHLPLNTISPGTHYFNRVIKDSDMGGMSSWKYRLYFKMTAE